MVDDVSEKQYVPFMVNRGLSYFSDTVLFANEMNRYHHLDKRLQFDFLINSIRKKKRFSKWAKPQEQEAIMIVKAYYDFSNEKARSAAALMTSEQIEVLRTKIYQGGHSAKSKH